MRPSENQMRRRKILKTNCPVPIRRCTGVSALVLQRFFEDVYVPAVPGKEQTGEMDLEARTLDDRQPQ